MSKFTECCGLRYIGDNHYPIKNGKCLNCNKVDTRGVLIAKLQKDLGKAVACLEFYGDIKSWERRETTLGLDRLCILRDDEEAVNSICTYWADDSAMLKDVNVLVRGGKRARACLKELRGE